MGCVLTLLLYPASGISRHRLTCSDVPVIVPPLAWPRQRLPGDLQAMRAGYFLDGDGVCRPFPFGTDQAQLFVVIHHFDQLLAYEFLHPRREATVAPWPEFVREDKILPGGREHGDRH